MRNWDLTQTASEIKAGETPVYDSFHSTKWIKWHDSKTPWMLKTNKQTPWMLINGWLQNNLGIKRLYSEKYWIQWWLHVIKGIGTDFIAHSSQWFHSPLSNSRCRALLGLSSYPGLDFLCFRNLGRSWSWLWRGWLELRGGMRRLAAATWEKMHGVLKIEPDYSRR